MDVVITSSLVKNTIHKKETHMVNRQKNASHTVLQALLWIDSINHTAQVQIKVNYSEKSERWQILQQPGEEGDG